MSTSVDSPLNRQPDRDSPAIKKINNLLNSPKTRVEGLQLLSFFLPRCRDEDFLQYSVSWMQNCCKLDGFKKNWNFSSHLLCNLLELSSNYPELKKSVSFFITTRYFDFFFKHFLNSESGWSCIKACLRFYRGACGPFQEGLEKLLLNEIQKNEKISTSVAQCVALIPCIGGGGNEGVNYKRNWKTQFKKFVSICHSLLNNLFADVEELQVQEYETTEWKSTQNEMETNMEYLTIQLFNHSTILCYMLLNQYPAPKNIPSDLTLQLICRGLSVRPGALERRQTTGVISLRKALPEIHCALLCLLKALIVSCTSQLLPYSHLLCKLMKQSLEWDFKSEGEERLRILAYETLCNWLAAAKNGSCAEPIADVLLSNALGDIRPRKELVFLKESKFQKVPKSKEARTRDGSNAGNSKLCYAALKTLQFLLKSTGVSLKPGLHKVLQELVVKLLIEVQKTAGSDASSSFALPSCRIELYSVLLELTLQPSPKWPPPTNFALRLFSRGLNDDSPVVSSFCSSALNFISLVIHPQYDNGAFPPSSASDDRNLEAEEPMEVEREVTENLEEAYFFSNILFENSKEPKEGDAVEKLGHLNEETEISSDEDSRNTVTFPKEVPESTNKTFGENEKEELEEKLNAGKQKASEERGNILLSPERSPTPRQTPESSKTSRVRESNRTNDSDGSKSVSPASTPEEGLSKVRYFLRSKTKGSSEEPEEASKRTNSPESIRSCAKISPSVVSSKKRPRTRALSKAEDSSEADAKPSGASEKICSFDDEEDIRAAFDDSFVD